MYNCGDIVSINFPFTDGSSVKKRPAFVVSGPTVNKSGDLILVQITSKVKSDAFELAINDSNVTIPLPLTSYIRTHKIFTLSENLVNRKISSANQLFLERVLEKVKNNLSDI